MNPFNRNAALWIVIVLLLALLYSVFQGGTTRTAGNTIPYSEFVRAVEQRQVQDVRISGNSITGTYREPRNGAQKFATYAPPNPPDEQLMQRKGLYARLYNMNYASFDDISEEERGMDAAVGKAT